MFCAIGRRGIVELFLEEFDKMRRIGEGALYANLRDRFLRRDQQHSRLHQPLANKPTMWRQIEVSFELLFERGERAIGLRSKPLDRDIAKDIAINHLLKIAIGRVGVAQHLAS